MTMTWMRRLVPGWLDVIKVNTRLKKLNNFLKWLKLESEDCFSCNFISKDSYLQAYMPIHKVIHWPLPLIFSPQWCQRFAPPDYTMTMTWTSRLVAGWLDVEHLSIEEGGDQLIYRQRRPVTGLSHCLHPSCTVQCTTQCVVHSTHCTVYIVLHKYKSKYNHRPSAKTACTAVSQYCSLYKWTRLLHYWPRWIITAVGPFQCRPPIHVLDSVQLTNWLQTCQGASLEHRLCW